MWPFDEERAAWREALRKTSPKQPRFVGIFSSPDSAVQGYKRSAKLQHMTDESALPNWIVIPTAHAYWVSLIN